MKWRDLRNKVIHKWEKMRLAPIRVYCCHHVSEIFDKDKMIEGDWIPIRCFKNRICELRSRGVEFISLTEAQSRMKNDYYRHSKYAVLTFDDGYASLKEILPWLKEQRIPVTVFVNPDYSDGKAFRDTEKEQYLSRKELNELGVEIGMHGMSHLDVSIMGESEFDQFVITTISNTSIINGYVPFWAYTWGRHSIMTDCVLLKNSITPVYIDGLKNYRDFACIHREVLLDDITRA